jgi:hypothetical protein
MAGVQGGLVGEDAHQGRFSSPVLAEQHVHLAGAGLEIDAIERKDGAVRLGDLAGLDCDPIGGEIACRRAPRGGRVTRPRLPPACAASCPLRPGYLRSVITAILPISATGWAAEARKGLMH